MFASSQEGVRMRKRSGHEIVLNLRGRGENCEKGSLARLEQLRSDTSARSKKSIFLTHGTWIQSHVNQGARCASLDPRDTRRKKKEEEKPSVLVDIKRISDFL